MPNKSLILLLVVAISFLSQPLTDLVENDFYYYAADAVKNLLLIALSFSAIVLLHKKKRGSILLVAFMLINLAVYPTNLLLLDENTYLTGVADSLNYNIVYMVRWDGTFSLSTLYTVIELTMVIQGIWSVGKYTIRSFMDWLRSLRSTGGFQCNNNSAVSE